MCEHKLSSHLNQLVVVVVVVFRSHGSEDERVARVHPSPGGGGGVCGEGGGAGCSECPPRGESHSHALGRLVVFDKRHCWVLCSGSPLHCPIHVVPVETVH